MRQTILLLAFALSACAQSSRLATNPSPSATGRWTLAAAEVIRPDGTTRNDYGAAPKGLLIVDASGTYSLQIFDAPRPKFATGDKSRGSPEEYRGALMGMSTHFGRVREQDGKLVFEINASSFPNWDGTSQTRAFTLEGDTLRYEVPPRPDGSIPVTIWKRMP